MYFVHALVNGSPLPIDLHFSDLQKALDEACAYIDSGADEVAISDGHGNRINGPELLACCRGERRLHSDLRSD